MQINGSLKLNGIMTDKILAGELDIPPYTKAPYVYMKMTIPVKNTGGAPAAMTDAERQGLLTNAFLFDFLYGKTLSFQPYQAQSLARLQREFRDQCGSEWEGYTDAVTGLATSIANGATTALVLWAAVPTGRLWWLGPDSQDDGAAGRRQLRTVELRVKRTVADLTAITGAGNFQINGVVTVDVIPYTVPAKGDPWCVLPEYREYSENTNEVKKLPDGATLRVSERTTVHASTALTNLLEKIDQLVLLDGLGPKDYITALNDIPNLPAEAMISDRETLLYKPRPYVTKKATLPTGTFYLRKNIPAELATLALGHLNVPIYSAEQIHTELDYLTTLKGLPRQAMKFVPLHVVQGRKLTNKALAIMEPLVAFTHDDREFETFPGYTAEPDKKGDVTVPHTVLDAAKAEYSRRMAAGEAKAAQDVVNSLASAIPGAVQSGRGFNADNPSIVHARVQGFFR